MKKRKQARLKFRMKVLAIIGAAVFMVTGVSEMYAQADIEEKKKAAEEVAQETLIPNTAETESYSEPESETSERPETSESQIESMDWSSDESYLLAKIAMAEAESEGVEGKALVMLVVLNRVWSDEFADTIEGVIYEKTGDCWQFSTVAEGGRFYTTEPDQECYEALELIQVQKWDGSQGALYFESKSNSTWHQNNLQFLFKYGNHYFYK